MIVLAVILLGVGVAGAMLQGHRRWTAAAPVVAAAIAVVCGVVDADRAVDLLEPLVAPVLFVLTAVPLSVELDRRGAFEAVARRLPVRGTAPGLWVLGAVTVALVNLDAAVVLLTPVAARAAARTGEDPVGLGMQPVLLASLASSVLPVSNLTNLISEELDPVGPGQFLLHLGPPTLAALAVGYPLWRRAWPRVGAAPAGSVHAGTGGAAPVGASRDPAEVPIGASPALDGVPAGSVRPLVGVAIVLAVGCTAGPLIGIEPWMVTAGLLVAAAIQPRQVPVGRTEHPGRSVRWSVARSVPWSVAGAVAGLAVLVGGVTAHSDVGQLLGSGEGGVGIVRLVGMGAVAANLVNNLPAFLVGVDALPPAPVARWAWLLGVNMGPTLLVPGSLAALLWLDVARRSGLDVGPGTYLRAGLRVGLPALAAATTVLVLTRG